MAAPNPVNESAPTTHRTRPPTASEPMLILKEGQQCRRPSRWLLGLPLVLVVIPVALFALSCSRPVEFRWGDTVATLTTFPLPTSSASLSNLPFFEVLFIGDQGSFDSSPLHNYPFNINRHRYLLQGVAHLRSLQIGNWCCAVGWCRGRRVK